MLVSGRFLLMRTLPALQIPNFKTTAPADKRNLPFQPNFLARLFGQNETPLPVRRPMLGARMKLAQKHAAISRGHIRIGFSRRAHAGKLLRRHDEEKLMIRFRQKNKFLARAATPACGNGDSGLIIDRMTKLTRVENFG